MDSKCERRGDTALYVACAGGHTDSVKLLLESKADVSKGTSSGISPLHAACRRGYKDTVKLLMKYKADISQCNSNKESPLYVACEGGHTSTAKLLLQNKADVALCNYKGESPLFVACKEGHKDTVKLLLQSFAEVSQCEYYGGNSPLHVVCDSSSSFPGIAKRRYKKKDPDCLEIVQLLIASKADVKMCNKKGNTPLDIARELNFYEIVHFLQKHL
ncbi:unnamed protein product [Mytilus coruscus]|uniref:Uncharacterized protein n=1 Tax=Mytilus coruscus TaxID=42192 RepID=A0A6J8DR05_MYTCO|nr:unnamed protein product [Mytilus coruscus]